MNRLSFEQVLDREGRLIYTNVGTSMLPLIRQGRDLMIIEKPHGRLKKYGVPLYKRNDGKYVLHRILKVRDNDYVICGDHCWRKEYGITDDHIIGELVGVVRNGQEISLDSWKCKLYAHLWCDFFPVRVIILRGTGVIRRIWRKVCDIIR